MMLQALYAGDFRPSEMKLEHPGCARAGREIEQLRAELEQKLTGEDFALVEKLLESKIPFMLPGTPSAPTVSATVFRPGCCWPGKPGSWWSGRSEGENKTGGRC